MTEVATSASSTCPPWCVVDTSDPKGHSHVSADVLVEALGKPLTARLVHVVGDTAVRVLVNDRVASVDQAEAFAQALRRLADVAAT